MLATRRRRNAQRSAGLWAAHLAAVEGEIASATLEYRDRPGALHRPRPHAAQRRSPSADGTAPLSSATHGEPCSIPILSAAPARAPRSRARRHASPTGRVIARIPHGEALDAGRTSLHDRDAPSTAQSTLAWTQAQVRAPPSRHQDATRRHLFQRLAGPRALCRSVAAADDGQAPAQRTGQPRRCGRTGISGDLPIVVVRIDEDRGARDASIRCCGRRNIGGIKRTGRRPRHPQRARLRPTCRSLHDVGLETMVRATSQARRPREMRRRTAAAVFVLRADHWSRPRRAPRCSRACGAGRCCSVGAAVSRSRLEAPHPRCASTTPHLQDRLALAGATAPATAAPRVRRSNSSTGSGGFGADGREYVTILGPGQQTPGALDQRRRQSRPSASRLRRRGRRLHVGLRSSRENQLTAMVQRSRRRSQLARCIYLRDERGAASCMDGDRESRSATTQATYVARHGAWLLPLRARRTIRSRSSCCNSCRSTRRSRSPV